MTCHNGCGIEFTSEGQLSSKGQEWVLDYYNSFCEFCSNLLRKIKEKEGTKNDSDS